MGSLNFVQLSNIDCGIASFVTALRIFSNYHVKMADIYERLAKESSVDMIDLAGAFVANGVTLFQLRSITFNLELEFHKERMDETKFSFPVASLAERTQLL
jgi:hypothetical protein